MKLLNNYNTALMDLCQYFDWNIRGVTPEFEDCTKYFWQLGNNDINIVRYSSTILEFIEGNYMENALLDSPKKRRVFRGKEYTAILVDAPHTATPYLQIFSNASEFVNPKD